MPVKLDALVEEARSLVRKAHNAFHPIHGFSTTSCQIYDTAWVAMISKEVQGEKLWLFPESFRFLLDTQAEDGSWGKHLKSNTVGILDTAAATLALLRHVKNPLQMRDEMASDLEGRIKRGLESLQTQLLAWDDVLRTNHIGVELIVPALLEYLQIEDETLTFGFDSRSTLMQMHKEKMARFQPESLYKAKPSSALHSLEALFGKVDFDRIGHHLFNGSMLSSPSSTAAFLQYSSSWSDEAEAYLQHIFVAGTGRGAGGFPGTYPTTYFELNWVLSTLLKGGFSLSELKSDEVSSIADIIIRGFLSDHGVIGFAPRAVDVDDTAKGLLTLSLLDMDESVSPDPMIAMFEGRDYFRTFLGERDPSFTSNCHVLLALLHRPDRSRYLPQIEKRATYLCKAWWDCDGLIGDKWHLSHLYPTMLLMQAFTELMCQIGDGAVLQGIFESETLSKVSICIFQACLRTLLGQNRDGSWNGQPEASSYAVLTLVEAGRLVMFQALKSQIEIAINGASDFLAARNWTSNDHEWTSKTAYRVTFVAEAYILAAMRASSTVSNDCIAAVSRTPPPTPPSERANEFLRLVGQTDLFSSMEEWKIEALYLESALFVPLLREHRLDVFDRDYKGVSKDHYIDMIPFTWIGCNNRSNTYAATSFMFEMMVISMLGYQVDEFMEAVAAPAFAKSTGEHHGLIDNILHEVNDTIGATGARRIGNLTWDGPVNDPYQWGDSPKATAPEAENESVAHDPLKRSITAESLRRFVQYVLTHQHVQNASLQDRTTLWRELRSFMHAHVIQIADNAERTRRPSGRTFFEWVRTTAADHVACAYSFAFACCIMSASMGGGESLFATVKEIYLVQAAARHMATMCRMCNDIGSIERDSAEGNTNSVDFPEFAHDRSVSNQKTALSELAEYERYCLMHTINQLEAEALQSRKTSKKSIHIQKRKVDIVRFFAEVTDFYDQLYMLQDLSSTIKK